MDDLEILQGQCGNPVSPDSEKPTDYYHGVLNYLNKMLMEEDGLENKPCMYVDSLALQAAEKSFHDALVGNHQSMPGLDQCSCLESTLNVYASTHCGHESGSGSIRTSKSFSASSCGEKRNLRFEDDVNAHKQLGIASEESEPSEVYDSALLCEHIDRLWLEDAGLSSCPAASATGNDNQKEGKSRKGCGKKKKNANKNVGEMIVDLTQLLIDCAEAMASNKNAAADQILKKIRKHSSAYGSSSERMAYYFANAVEARLAGTGTLAYRAFSSARISAAQILTSYKAYITACPFHRMSNIFANKSIAKQINSKDKLHIVDFGILYGFQWPCIIEGLSLRPGGPPRLKITGIDLPQPGPRPAERVEETGRRLADYARRFNVPFEYHSVAKNWENVRKEDLKIESDEMLVVNSIYRMKNVLDETVVESRPRDKVLDFIRSLNPELFVHGILNGTYNATYFQTRFKEAVFHFTKLFDMFEATTTEGEDKERSLFEQEVFGRDIMNVVACEGRSRVERPETYKKWGARNAKAGFRQVPLFPDLVKEVRAKVKSNYHREFMVDEDSNWMLQGWKGRVLYALSLWTPERTILE